jgi:small subunit ribosomal protein S1
MSADEEDFAALFEASERTRTGRGRARPRVGDEVSGRIVSIGRDAVFVDLGGKAEGSLERSQVEREGILQVEVGDEIVARVAEDDGGVVSLRMKIARSPGGKGAKDVDDELVRAAQLGIPAEGLVTEVVKGGLSVTVAGVRGFCPASQIDTRFVEKLDIFVGQRLTFRVTKYEPGRRGNLVLSRRVLLEEERAALAAKTRETLQVGAVLSGTVVAIKPFGVFVDLGGIEGMLHVSELGFTRVDKPDDVLHLGQDLEVAVLSITKGDKGERIALSLKALAADPWPETAAILTAGSRVAGVVTRLQPFGAFVEVAPGVEGLVHISELGAERPIAHPREAVSVGQRVEATVLTIDVERRRLALTLTTASDASSREIADAVAEGLVNQPGTLGTLGDLATIRNVTRS